MYSKPAKLSTGSRIGIFLPASAVKPTFRDKGLNQLRQLGFVPKEVPDIFSQSGFRAKKAQQSVADLQQMMTDPRIEAVWAARGGYGSNHLLPLISSLRIPTAKIVIGSSDVSYLLWYLMDRHRMVVFYGPMAYSALAEGRYDTGNLWDVLAGRVDSFRVQGTVLKPGKAGGIISGGCLANLVSLIGTSYFPELSGRLLLLEDVNERPFRLDRMFWQLLHSGALDSVSGLILGQFPGCFNDDIEREDLMGRWLDYLSDQRIPILSEMPFGHADTPYFLPLGVRGEVDTVMFEGLTICEKGVR